MLWIFKLYLRKEIHTEVDIRISKYLDMINSHVSRKGQVSSPNADSIAPWYSFYFIIQFFLVLSSDTRSSTRLKKKKRKREGNRSRGKRSRRLSVIGPHVCECVRTCVYVT